VAGQGEGRFDAVWKYSVTNIDKCHSNIILGKKVFLGVLTNCSCQRLLNKPRGCVVRVLKADPQSCTHKELSAVQLCLWDPNLPLACLHAACRAREIPPPWDAEDTIFLLSLLRLCTCSHSHFSHCTHHLHLTAAGFSQTISSLLSGHTCRKK